MEVIKNRMVQKGYSKAEAHSGPGVGYDEQFTPLGDRAAWISLMRRSVVLTSWQREKWRHYNACPQLVSWRGKQQSSAPKGRHTWSRYRERNTDTWNLVSPCGRSSYASSQTGL